MPRYFFQVHDGKDIPDQEGAELADLTAAQIHAVCYAGDLIRANPQHFITGDIWSMEVTDETGLTLYNLTFLLTASPAAGPTGAASRV